MAERAHEEGPQPRRLLVFALCLANFMATLDVFVVNVALNDISVDLGHSNSLADVSWVLNAYTIVFGALLIPAGRVADWFGQKGVFTSGISIFGAASIWCAVSGSVWMLVAARCIQAAGAAILVPSSLGLILTTSRPDRRAANVRIWAVTASLAAAAGPVVGGLLTQIHWSLIFLVNVPIGVLCLIGAARSIPKTRAADSHTPIPSPFEAALIIITIGAVSAALVKGSDWGWIDARTIVTWLVAVVGAITFLVVNRRTRSPLLDLALFRDRLFASSNIAILLTGAAMGTELLGLSLLLQKEWSWSPVATGLGLAPSAVTTFIAAQLGSKLFPRLRPITLAFIGCVIAGAGQILMVLGLAAGHPDYLTAILPAWLIIGFGGGLAIPTIIASGTKNLDPLVSSSGSAVVQMSRQIGSVTGAALLVAILGASAMQLSPYLVTWICTSALWFVGGFAILTARNEPVALITT
jgi:EmrB/QacA subfamily drug resistance transporter